jgi:hypothetical protein
MSARPGDWHLLDEPADPWPGDPYEVSREARSFNDAAAELRGQVARLRTLADDSVLVGEFAPALRDSARELAHDLERAQNRFDTVATELSTWATTLDDARTDSWTYLERAETAHRVMGANQPPTVPVDGDDVEAVSQDRVRQGNYDGAASDLRAARRDFEALRAATDRVAHQVASSIRDASHDSLKDHRFDWARKWIHEHRDLLKLIADVLSWIATITVVAILLLSNPAGWIALVGLLATLGALAIHAALAANGDGSWLDVGMDVFALLTLGTGKLLTGGAKAAYALRTGFVPAFKASSSAARAAFASSRGLAKVWTYATRSNVVVRNLTAWSRGMTAYDGALSAAVHGNPGWAGRLAFGEKEAAALYDNIGRAMTSYPSSLLLRGGRWAMIGTSGAFLSATTVDVAGKVVFPSLDVGQFGWHVPYGDHRNLVPGIPRVVDWIGDFGVNQNAW